MRNFGLERPPKFLRQPLPPGHEQDGGTYTAVAMTLALAGALIIVMVLAFLNTAVGAAPSCLTMREARAQWPNDHLWWRTRNHCWSNEPGYGTRKARWLPHPSLDPNGNVAHHSGRPLLVEPPQLTEAQIDEMQYNEEAEQRLATCCWPPEESIAFTERWLEVPLDWQLAMMAENYDGP